jgi:hypothetical protein
VQRNQDPGDRRVQVCAPCLRGHLAPVARGRCHPAAMKVVTTTAEEQAKVARWGVEARSKSKAMRRKWRGRVHQGKWREGESANARRWISPAWGFATNFLSSFAHQGNFSIVLLCFIIQYYIFCDLQNIPGLHDLWYDFVNYRKNIIKIKSSFSSYQLIKNSNNNYNIEFTKYTIVKDNSIFSTYQK